MSDASEQALPPLNMSEVQRRVTAELDRMDGVLGPLGRRFVEAGETWHSSAARCAMPCSVGCTPTWT